MSTDTVSTRRSFLKVGALLATPIAAPAAAAIGDGAMAARLARHEDEAAIRALHRAWLRRVNAGDEALSAGGQAVRGIAADHGSEPDAIEIAANGREAMLRFRCTVETETELPRDCTLGQMAHAQGCGFVRRSEPRLVTAAYVRGDEGWTLARVDMAAA